MTRILFTFMSLLFISTAIAQKRDTTIYSGCRLKTDTIPVVDGDGLLMDSCPQFKNGPDDLYKFINENIHYPASARKNHVEGRVIVSMIIEKDGSVSHAKVERGVSKEIDKETLRLINSLPKWNPGVLHGKPVRVRYALVVPFKLPDKKK